MTKIFLFGYYGFGNLGDELLAGYFLRRIGEAFPETGLVLLTREPWTRPQFRETRVSRWNLARVMKMLSTGDLLVGGGGGIFQDMTSRRSLLYYLALLKAARWKKARVMLFGQGFGPLSEPGAALTARALREVEALSCRDRLSTDFLSGMGLGAGQFRLGVDPLWDLPPARPVGEPAAPPVVGVFLRRGGWKRKLGLLSVLNRELDGRLRLFALAPEDYPAVCRLAGKLGGRPAVYLQSLAQLDTVCAGLSLVLGERLHGLLLAACREIPGIGLGDDPKISAFCREMGWASYYWQEAGLAGKVRGRLEEVFTSYTAARQELLAVRENMRRRAREDRLWFLDRIKEALP